MNAPLFVETSPGEIFDRITILQIKERRIEDERKRANVRVELAVLRAASAGLVLEGGAHDIVRSLQAVNERLWQIEDDLRDCERRGDFGASFIHLARSVYQENDERAALKRRLNVLFGSVIIEEKSYASTAA